jgi:hypothetical protein
MDRAVPRHLQAIVGETCLPLPLHLHTRRGNNCCWGLLRFEKSKRVPSEADMQPSNE